MTTNSRPTLARRHTRASEAKRSDELDAGIRIQIDGDDGKPEIFEVRVGDVTPALARELRGHIGMSFMRLMQTAAEDPDIDLLTAIEWLARRIRGEDVDFDDVEFSYADLGSNSFEIGEPGPLEEADANPE